MEYTFSSVDGTIVASGRGKENYNKLLTDRCVKQRQQNSYPKQRGFGPIVIMTDCSPLQVRARRCHFFAKFYRNSTRVKCLVCRTVRDLTEIVQNATVVKREWLLLKVRNLFETNFVHTVYFLNNKRESLITLDK